MTKLYHSFLIISLLFISLPAYAQVRTVTGRVTDEKGAPVAGVHVAAKGTQQATLTAGEGQYSLSLPEGANTLVFTFSGMETREINVGNSDSPINVRMVEKITKIDQIVITGYAQTTTKMMTGSVGVLTSESFENKPITSVDGLMQGQLAGVAVTATSGQPGRSQDIRIRGTNTLSDGNSSPLWVVDGVPLQGEMPNIPSKELKTAGFESMFVNGVGNINPNDIENISVLKDAAAAAIYGSRAANGVIVVTTKRGHEGAIRVNYSGNVSVVMKPQRDGDLMNSREKLAWEQELWDEFSAPGTENAQYNTPIVGVVGMIRAGIEPFAYMKGDKAAQDAYIAELGKHTTNWFDVVFRNAISTNHHLSVGGGGKTSSYYVSLGYTNESGLLIKDNYERYSILANYGITPGKAVKLDMGIDMAHQSSKSPNLSSVNPFSYAYFANPYEKPRNEDGTYKPDLTYNTLGQINGDNFNPAYVRGFNILKEIENTSSHTANWSTTARLNAEFKLAPTLKLVGLASYTFDNNKTDRINLKDTYAAFEDRFSSAYNELYFGSIHTNTVNRTGYIARAHLSYTENYGVNHNLSVIGGTEIRESDSKTVYRKGYRYNPTTGSTSIPPPPPAGASSSYLNEVNSLSGDNYYKSRFASFYLSADYFLMNRYIFNISVRTDGSSHFGTERQFSPTWSAGAAWHIMNEGFMEPVEKVVNRLILRASTGFTGNVNTFATPYIIMTYEDQIYRKYGNDEYDMGKFIGAPNPYLRWERTFDYKVSLDFGLFEDRLSGIVEGYYQKSTDIVKEVPIPSVTGYSSQRYNSVDMMNTGLEVTLRGGIVRTGNWKLDVSANFSYNINRVLNLIQEKFDVGSDDYMEGYPAMSILAGKVIGIDSYTGLYEFQLRSDAELNNMADLQDPNNYRFYLGTLEAPYTGGFNVTAGYKQFSLSVSGVYSWGSKTYENIITHSSSTPLSGVKGNYKEFPQTAYNDLYTNHLNVRRDRTNRWKNVNDEGTKYPRIIDPYGIVYDFSNTNPTASNIVGGVYLKDNSYVRIKTILLSYVFSEKLLSGTKISNLKLYLSLNNFFTFTNYEGLDPETPGALYPITRSGTFGVTIGF